MRNGIYNPDLTPGDIIARPKFKQSQMPSEKELKARHSFPCPDSNRHIDKFIKQTRH
ncbi:DUF2737 family protein [Dryocola clanedunensis]